MGRYKEGLAVDTGHTQMAQNHSYVHVIILPLTSSRNSLFPISSLSRLVTRERDL